jgi:diacylglycerol kinase (ATP)
VRKKIAFVVNPNSANGTTGREWPEIEAMAKDCLGEFESRLTTAPGDAKGLAAQVIRSGAETVVCVGGDGTLNEVVNGVMNATSGANREVLVGYIPRGTGCDLTRTIPLPRNLDEAFENIIHRRHRFFDLGRLRYLGHSGQTSVRYFHNVASFGLGGEVDRRVNEGSKFFGGFVSFIWATLFAVLRFSKKPITLRVDDQFHEEVVCWNVAVANGQYHGGGMWVAPGAIPNDGLFQVTIIGDLSLAQVFQNLPKLYNGKIYEVDKVRMLTGRCIEASSSQDVLLDLDGEQPGMLPVFIEMVPGAFPLICG